MFNTIQREIHEKNRLGSRKKSRPRRFRRKNNLTISYSGDYGKNVSRTRKYLRMTSLDKKHSARSFIASSKLLRPYKQKLPRRYEVFWKGNKALRAAKFMKSATPTKNLPRNTRKRMKMRLKKKKISSKSFYNNPYLQKNQKIAMLQP